MFFLSQAIAECLKNSCKQSMVMSSIDSMLCLTPSEVCLWPFILVQILLIFCPCPFRIINYWIILSVYYQQRVDLAHGASIFVVGCQKSISPVKTFAVTITYSWLFGIRRNLESGITWSYSRKVGLLYNSSSSSSKWRPKKVICSNVNKIMFWYWWGSIIVYEQDVWGLQAPESGKTIFWAIARFLV